MKRVIIYNHGGSGNHGCEALARTTINLLKNDYKIILCTESPQQDIHYGLNDNIELLPALQSYSKLSLSFIKAYLKLKINKDYFEMDMLPYKKALKEISSQDIAISIGGDIYCYDDYPKYIKYHQMMRKKGCKTVLLGCSINKKLFDDPEFVKDMKSYDLITARESLTYGLLKEAGMNNVKSYPDMAFTLPVKDVELPKEFVPGNTVGINVSPLVIEREKTHGMVMKNYERLITYILNNTDCSVALIPHVVWEGNDDRTVLKELFDKVNDTGRVVLINDSNCMALKGYISKCRFFIGARTHATIAAYSTGVPTLVVGYSIKSRGIAKDLFGTYDNYVISVEDLNVEDNLSKSFKWILDNEENIRDCLEDKIKEYKEKAYNIKGLLL